MFNVRPKSATQEDRDLEAQANAGAQPGVFRDAGAIDVDTMREQSPDGDYAMVPRDPEIAARPGDRGESTDKTDLFAGRAIAERDAPVDELLKRKHQILMETLEEEAERQAEERQQAQIDHEYYDHQQWTAEEARVLQARGQAPLVYNEARGSIDWLCGTERRMRKDYKIRPRSREDEPMAETKTKLFKYVDDVNMGPWHRSRSFKQCVISGLGWLEEAINLDPERELIYAGSEDWRRVFRDSRGREFDQSDWRYIHRRKIVDLDYACMLLPKASRHFMSIAGRWGDDEDEADDVWYLGQHLTSAHSAGWMTGDDGVMGGDYSVRRSGKYWDRGRRNSVEMIESWYRVPESVQVFGDGPMFRKVMNPADPAHVQAKQAGTPMYETVKWCMRVMISTKYQPCWDGRSPYRHGQFSLIPIWGYRRGRDGLAYGAMRGMRDPQDDLNKRRSKALFALSVNQLIVRGNAVEDLEDLREENARADGILVVTGDINASIKKEKYPGDVTQNLEMAAEDRVAIRNAGGVTGDNRGEESSAISGKAIIAKQEQGSLVTFELFDNFLLAFKMAGQRRMSNIEQFCNQPWAVRIDPEGQGLAEWVHVNQRDPRTGQYLNDITSSQADFIVDQQDYRATLTQSAMDSMFELLGRIATFAPQVVVNLLDLVVDSADIQNKNEWVARIRKMTGQRDPSKPPTPEEQQADAEAQQQQKELQQLTLDEARAKVDTLKAKITDTNAAKVLKNLQGLLAAIEGAATVVAMPGVALPADQLARAAGFVDETPVDPIITGPAGGPQPMPMGGAKPGQNPASVPADIHASGPGGLQVPAAAAAVSPDMGQPT